MHEKQTKTHICANKQSTNAIPRKKTRPKNFRLVLGTSNLHKLPQIPDIRHSMRHHRFGQVTSAKMKTNVIPAIFRNRWVTTFKYCHLK